MKEYQCTICGYIYNPEENNNIAFEKLDSDWICPICQAEKNQFTELN